jgi:hypothetical protein
MLTDDPYDWPDLGGPKVTHLVFVDGRLVDTWHEPAAGTPWQAHVAPAPPPPPPPPPPVHERVLDWLGEVCGGRAAVDALTTDPLTDDAIDLPDEYPDRPCRERMEATAELVDAVAERWFDAESSFAFRHALLTIWAEDPETVLRAATAAHLAGGICWAVGKANGLYNPAGVLRVGRVQEALALRSPISGYGGTVAAALRGFRGRPADRWGRPPGVPDLLPLGRSDLLLGVTRERLVRIRERARQAARAA